MTLIDWTLLRAFHATATTGSLSAAARVLQLTQPTLSRQIALLESRLGLVLFQRSKKRLVLSAEGRALLPHASAMALHAQEFALAATGQSDDVQTPITLSVTQGYAAYLMPAIIAGWQKEWPDLRLTLLAQDTLTDLHAHEADLALRHAPPAQAGLVGDRLPDRCIHFYASADWIVRHGMPHRLADIPMEQMIGMDQSDALAAFMGARGHVLGEGQHRLITINSMANWEMARLGLGVVPMLDEIAARFPQMRRVCPDMPPLTVPLWLVAHRQVHGSARVARLRALLLQAFTGPEGPERAL